MSTYTPIASVTLSDAQSSVTFSNLPQTYTDLVIRSNFTNSTSATVVQMTLNGDTGTNYSRWQLWGNGSGTGDMKQTSQNAFAIGYWQTGTGNQIQSIVNLMSYANTTIYKGWLARWNQVAGIDNSATASTGNWQNTAAVTSITLSASSGNIVAGSTFDIYGISSAGIVTPKATGGDIVYSDGTYWYHTFTSSGTFTPSQSLTADYLVVAGGGAGGTYFGGGGGGGGMRCTVTATGGGGSLESALSLTAQAYTVTVGAGGAGSNSVAASNGSNSVFSTITATGGGAGGAFSSNPSTGGSGGGGSTNSSSGQTGGAGTANQGYAGGNGTWDGSNRSAAGGGGAGAAGSANSGAGGGNGGAGVATSISGVSTYYAAGGGGCAYTSGTNYGTGGSSIGGNGGTRTIPIPTSGLVNTGSGGGGAADGPYSTPNGYAGGNGGSGVVIIRYAA